MQFIENEVKQVGPGFWIRVAIDNISWYDLGQGAAVIDALEDPTQADVVRGLIEKTTGSQLKWVVTTHWDADHIACNPQWRREGALVIAHQSCADSAGDWMDVPISPTPIMPCCAAPIHDVSRCSGWVAPTRRGIRCSISRRPSAAHRRSVRLGPYSLPAYPGQDSATPRGPDAGARIRCGCRDLRARAGDRLEDDPRFCDYFEEMLAAVPPRVRNGQSTEEIEREVPPPADMRDWWRFVDWKHKRTSNCWQSSRCKSRGVQAGNALARGAA